MKIRMLRTESLQHAGQQLPLTAGEVYDLSDVIARALVADGLAVACELVLETKQEPKKGRRRAA